MDKNKELKKKRKEKRKKLYAGKTILS